MKKQKVSKAKRGPLSSSEDEAFYEWLKQNILRRAFRRWPPYSLVLKRCKVEYFVGNRRRVGHICEKCGVRVDRKEIAVDHIVPVGAPSDVGALIKLMFCPIDNLQALCNYTLTAVREGKYDTPSCHYIKTQLERGNEPKTTEEIRQPKKAKRVKKDAPTKKNKRGRTLGKAPGGTGTNR